MNKKWIIAILLAIFLVAGLTSLGIVGWKLGFFAFNKKDDSIDENDDKKDDEDKDKPTDPNDENDDKNLNDVKLDKTKPTYHLLSVGNGLFSYVQVGNQAVVLDAGRGRPGRVAIDDFAAWRSTQAGFDFIEQDLNNNGVDEVVAVFISHAHEDHTWFLGELIKRKPVKDIIMPVRPLFVESSGKDNGASYDDTVNKLREPTSNLKGQVITELKPTYSYLGINFENLIYDYQDEISELGRTNINNNSLILRFNLDKNITNSTILFTGDADKEEANVGDGALLNKLKEVKIDLYQVPHHGSNVSGNELFLQQIGANLKYAIISGTFATEEWKNYGGAFKFPRPETIQFLNQYAPNSKIFVTGALAKSPLESDPKIYNNIAYNNASFSFGKELNSENSDLVVAVNAKTIIDYLDEPTTNFKIFFPKNEIILLKWNF